ncbi:MAG: P1 family peptidase [Filifactoraceae bacterium]
MRKRIKDILEVPGRFHSGERNSITDVSNVTVGHFTYNDEEKHIHTGITIISPHNKNAYDLKCPAAVFAGNGYGKLIGAMQIEELGEIESLIGLTNTLSISQVIEGLLDYHLPLMEEKESSINIVVGEVNDGYLSDIKGRHIKAEHVKLAIENLSKEVEEGNVGAGTGTRCYGYKGGIGTSSRIVPKHLTGEKEYTVGVLVQSNFGMNLDIYGKKMPYKDLPNPQEKGSCMIIVATDAPLSDRQLKRLSKRAMIGLTNTGSYMSHGSGDFVIAFSNCENNLRSKSNKSILNIQQLNENHMDFFFEAVMESTQEAIYNSLFMAETLCGIKGRKAESVMKN